MIVNKRTNYVIANPEEVLEKPIHIFENFDASEWSFVFPEEITDDQTKVIFKIGFLKLFIKNLYPTLTNNEIYSIINIDWQVFIGSRQMERRWKEYVNLFEKKEED